MKTYRWPGWETRWCPKDGGNDALSDPNLVAVGGLAAIGLAVATYVGMFMQPWLTLPVAGLGLLGWQLWRRRIVGRLRGWQIEPEGLYEVRWGQSPMLLPWSVIEAVEESSDSRTVRVVTDARTIDIPLAHCRDDRFVERLRQGLERGQSTGPELDPSRIAEWLGVLGEERLHLSDAHVPVAWQPLAILALCLPLLYAAGFSLGVGSFLAYVCWIGLQLAWNLRSEHLTIGVDGIRDGTVLRERWEEVEAVRRGVSGWSLITRRRRYPLSGAIGDRVVTAARNVLAARSAGQTLPRMTDIPEAALSRAEAVGDSSERGISLTEDRP